MCDFRSPEQVLAELKEHGVVVTFMGEVTRSKMEEVTTPGLYYILASGSFYTLFDGHTFTFVN